MVVGGGRPSTPPGGGLVGWGGRMTRGRGDGVTRRGGADGEGAGCGAGGGADEAA